MRLAPLTYAFIAAAILQPNFNAEATDAATTIGAFDRSIAQSEAPSANPPNDDSTQPAQPAPQASPKKKPESLSKKLDRSGGVVTPPPTGDPSVQPPPHQENSPMPVIPPPGTPGGDPEVQPK